MITKTWTDAIATAIELVLARWKVGGQDAEDLAIEMWIVALEDDQRIIKRFEGRSSRVTYLFRIFSRRVGRVLRTAREHRLLQRAAAGALRCGYRASREDAHLVALKSAMRSLSADERLVLRLWTEGYSFREIGARTELTEKAAQQRVYRIVVRLRTAFAPLAAPPRERERERERELNRSSGHRP